MTDEQKLKVVFGTNLCYRLSPRSGPYGEVFGVECFKKELAARYRAFWGLGSQQWRCVCPKCDPDRFNEALRLFDHFSSSRRNRPGQPHSKCS